MERCKSTSGVRIAYEHVGLAVWSECVDGVGAWPRAGRGAGDAERSSEPNRAGSEPDLGTVGDCLPFVLTRSFKSLYAHDHIPLPSPARRLLLRFRTQLHTCDPPAIAYAVEVWVSTLWTSHGVWLLNYHREKSAHSPMSARGQHFHHQVCRY